MTSTEAGESDEGDAVEADVTVGAGDSMAKTNPKSKYGMAGEQRNPI